MRFSRLAVLVGFLKVLSGAEAWASEAVVSDLPPEYIIKRIKEVRQGWEVVEVEFAQFEYHPAFDSPDVKSRFVARGRFVLTPPDCGELETFPVDGKGRKRDDKAQDRYVWTADEFQVLWSQTQIEKIPRTEIRARNEQIRTSEKENAEPKPIGMLQGLFIIFSPREWDIILPESPKDCLPLVYADDAEALAERFELTVLENDEFFFLIASPKLLRDRRQYSNLAICLDRKTFIPIAQRTVVPGGDYYSYAVTSLRVNGEDITPPAQPEKKQ